MIPLRVNACQGCGRPLALRAPIECPCWRSVKYGAVIPLRIRNIQARITGAYRAMSTAQTEQQHKNAAAVVRSINMSLAELA